MKTLEELKQEVLNEYDDKVVALAQYLEIDLNFAEEDYKLEEVKELLNLTDSELEVFNQLSKGKCKIEVSSNCLLGTSTVDRRVKSINQKLLKLGRL